MQVSTLDRPSTTIYLAQGNTIAFSRPSPWCFCIPLDIKAIPPFPMRTHTILPHSCGVFALFAAPLLLSLPPLPLCGYASHLSCLSPPLQYFSPQIVLCSRRSPPGRFWTERSKRDGRYCHKNSGMASRRTWWARSFRYVRVFVVRRDSVALSCLHKPFRGVKERAARGGMARQ